MTIQAISYRAAVRKRLLSLQEPLTWLVLVNVAVFVGLHLSAWIVGMDLVENKLMVLFELPADIVGFCEHWWSALTYMFCQLDATHLVVNMLLLVWLGKVLERYSRSEAIVAVSYLTGGLGGGIVYVVCGSLYDNLTGYSLVGSSAAVCGVAGVLLCAYPKLRIQLPWRGGCELRVLIVVLMVIDMAIGVSGDNFCGHLSHLGGLSAGMICGFWLRYMVSNERRMEETDISPILDKMKSSGYSSLSDEEKCKLRYKRGN